MHIELRPYDVDQLYRRRTRINLRPQYQRTLVWNDAKKQLLADTILRGYDIPKLYFRKPDNEQYEFEVIDGQQRLNAIWEFLANNLTLPDEASDLPGGDLAGKRYLDLTNEQQDTFNQFQFTCAIVSEATDLQIKELFLRLQEGVSLNPAEKRNAMAGRMRDFVRSLAETHRVFPLTNIKNVRYAWDDLAALVTCIALNDGATDIKAPSLRRMYAENTDFPHDGPVAARIKKSLNLMEKVLATEPPEMDIKWGFVDLFLLIYSLQKGFSLRSREEDLRTFYVGFEQARRLVDDLSSLAAR